MVLVYTFANYSSAQRCKSAFIRPTKVGKLKLTCVNVTQHVGKLLATNITCF